MSRLMMVIVAALGMSVLCCACAEPEPSYKVELIAFDPGLVGRWRLEPKDKEDEKTLVEVEISGRSVEIKHGATVPEGAPKLAGGWIAPEDTKSSPPNALRGVVTVSHVEGKVSERPEIECKGFAISVEEISLLAFQPSVQQMGIAYLGGMVLPIQQAMKFRCDGDVLTLWVPKARVGWVPDSIWLDRRGEPTNEAPDLGNFDDGPRRITPEIDRFVAVFGKYGAREDFWNEPKVFHRVK